jgi:ABC-type antimicrobial peptide transport system permease subunit
MFRASLKSLAAHKLRLALSGVAVVLGIAFVAGSFIFTDTLSRTFDRIFEDTSAEVTVSPRNEVDAGVEVSAVTLTLPASVLEQVQQVDGVDAAEGGVAVEGVQIIGSNGKVVGTQGPPALGVDWSDTPGISPLRLEEGRAPERAGEVVIDQASVDKGRLELGQSVPILLPNGPRTEVELVGIASAGNLIGVTLTAFDRETAQTLLSEPDSFTSIGVRVADGFTQEEVRDSIAAALPEYDVATQEQLGEDLAADFRTVLNFINIFLLVFAGIALFVGSFIILNTFSMLVAQRLRELALLRAVGASRRQVTRSVMIEAFVVGLIGSTLGVVVGIGIAYLLRLIFSTLGLELGEAGLVLLPRTIAVAYVLGIVVTMLAAYLPARRAARVPPVAAMRTDVTMQPRSLRLRGILGAIVAIAGGAALAASFAPDGVGARSQLVGIGALLLIVGLVMLTPALSRPVIRALGAVYPRLFGTVGRLGRDNAIRNPRRTAATASALMVGLTLVAGIGVLASSTNASIAGVVDRSLGADYIVSDAIGTPFSPEIANSLEDVEGVETVTRFRATGAAIDGSTVFLGAADAAGLEDTVSLTFTTGDVTGLEGRGILLDTGTSDDLGVGVGDELEVTFQGQGEQTLRVGGVFEPNQIVGGYLISTETLTELGGDPRDNYVYVDAAEGTDTLALGTRLEERLVDYPNVVLKDQTAFKEEQRGQVNQLLYLIYALLALAIIIAVLGIVNTLALSVIERTREIGLLRAVGMGRRQLRRMVRLESVVIAVFGALLGLGLGVLLGVTLQRAIADEGVDVLSIPIGLLLVFLVVSGLVGVLAAVWPARRAARLDVLRAVTTE